MLANSEENEKTKNPEHTKEGKVVNEAETKEETLETTPEKQPIKVAEEEGKTATSKTIENTEVTKEVSKEPEVEKEEKVVVNYDEMTLEKLVEALQEVLKNPVHEIKKEVEGIKSAFNQKFGSLLAEKKAAFLAEGGNTIDFHFSSPIKTSYNKLLSTYKEKRNAYYGALELAQKKNLEKRLEVIEALKELIKNADSATMYKNFKELESTWKAIGAVPKSKYNDTWKIYYHHVERFYDLLHLNNDLRELDFKHNLEAKLKIIARAEELVEKSDVNVAFKELQQLHKVWKEDIGPVGREYREDIWKKFSTATKKIHDKRHDYFRSLDSKHEETIATKLAIIAKIEAYDTSQNKTHNDWQRSFIDVEKIKEEYFKTPKLPYAKSEKVWQKFKQATKKFNHEKNAFYKQEKNVQKENLQKKQALIEIAESVKDSEDWEVATNIVKKIQADWKKIGHVPRKFSDETWKRFKDACNHYFHRLHEKKNTINKEQQAFIEEKTTFLENLNKLENPPLEKVKELMREWRKLGRLPKNARNLDTEFNKKINTFLEALSIDRQEMKMLKFSNIIDGYLADENVQKLDAEKTFVRKKIDEVEKELQQLENNLSFFSNSDENNPLLQNVRENVANFKEELEIWKLKLAYLKKLAY